jgi:hypothetical protein
MRSGTVVGIESRFRRFTWNAFSLAVRGLRRRTVPGV